MNNLITTIITFILVVGSYVLHYLSSLNRKDIENIVKNIASTLKISTEPREKAKITSIDYDLLKKDVEELKNYIRILADSANSDSEVQIVNSASSSSVFKA